MLRPLALLFALAVPASAQSLTEFEGRVLSGALFGPVYADARAALALADSTGTWPGADALPNGSQLAFEAGPDGGWELAFVSRPYAAADTLEIGALTGSMLLPPPSADSCMIAYQATVESGRVTWGARGTLDAAGVASGLRRCRLE